MTTLTNATSISTAIDVKAPIERAFHVFTAEMGTWWDTDKHILTAPLAEMVFQPRVGGNIIDRGTDGSECRWSRVLAYDPPDRVCFSWDINTRWQIETDPARCSEIEITFTRTAPARTRVVLTHRHLDRHGDDWESMRDAVSSGWDLTRFAQVAKESVAHEQILGRVLPTITDQRMQARVNGASSYTAILLRATDKFVRTEVDSIIWELGRRNMALVDAGMLHVVLPVNDDTDLAGIGIFALTPRDAATVMDADPAVQAGIFSYDIHPVRGFPGSTLG